MMLKLIAGVAVIVIALVLVLIGVPILKNSDDELILNKQRRADIDNSL